MRGEWETGNWITLYRKTQKGERSGTFIQPTFYNCFQLGLVNVFTVASPNQCDRDDS